MRAVDREIKEKIGVSATQVAALLYLQQNNGCLHNDLSRELLQTKSATTTLVERMEKNGLIVRKKCATDRRASRLFLTDKGDAMCSKAVPFISTYEQELTRGFHKDDIAKVEKVLAAIIEKYQTLPENYFYSEMNTSE